MFARRFFVFGFTFATLAASATTIFADEAPVLSRTNLLIYRAKKGIRPVKSVRDWEARRADILVNMQKIMGPLPGKEKRSPLDVKIEEEVDCGSYLRRLITYSPQPNARIPAYLLIPKTALEKNTKCPAVLALHPTDSLGQKVVVNLGGKEHRQYGSELAERGYVVIAPPYPLLANYQVEPKSLGFESGTMLAIWNNIRSLDVLDSLPFVKKGHYGAIGHSLGGHNSIYTAVFDQRIKVIVSSSGFDSYIDYMDGNIKGWTQTRYMPKLAQYASSLGNIPFDFYELIGALAPRVVFVNAPKADANFKWQSVDKIVASARPIFKLYGVEDHLRVEHPDCPHDFPDDMRQMAYKIFDENLK
jgi:hypothetical protein